MSYQQDIVEGYFFDAPCITESYMECTVGKANTGTACDRLIL